ncbi:unnamed protein product [Mytilus edulis]|uniref:CCHC-type domain-containing protein n=1 Tax=Mytilus edulis TaxID=6550 RepID=A0A8S3UN00_MYTED|nr:unnamed protein product [Mytilus edulis]
MKVTEAQNKSTPHRGRCYNRDVLVTVQGRQSLCLRCNQFGHHRATCPETVAQKKTYAQMARLDPGESAGCWENFEAKLIDLRYNTRGQVIAALEDVVDVKNLEAIYKTGEGSEWYLTFITDAEVEVLGDGARRRCKERGSVVFERIDSYGIQPTCPRHGFGRQTVCLKCGEGNTNVLRARRTPPKKTYAKTVTMAAENSISLFGGLSSFASGSKVSLQGNENALATSKRKRYSIIETGEGAEWYITFLTSRETELLGDGKRRDLDEEGGVVYFDRIDKRQVKLPNS